MRLPRSTILSAYRSKRLALGGSAPSNVSNPHRSNAIHEKLLHVGTGLSPGPTPSATPPQILSARLLWALRFLLERLLCSEPRREWLALACLVSTMRTTPGCSIAGPGLKTSLVKDPSVSPALPERLLRCCYCFHGIGPEVSNPA
jgi:hypothetical protein